MAVRYQHSVEVFDALTKSLLAKVGRRVYQNRLPAVLYKHRDAQTLVARVVRRAGLALAAD